MNNEPQNIELDEKSKRCKYLPGSGLLFSFAGAVVSAFGAFFLKTIQEDKMKVVLVRGIFQYIVAMLIVTYNKSGVVAPTMETQVLLVVRGLLAPTVMIMLGYSMNYLTLGDAMTLYYTYPIFVLLFACLCINEKCSIINVILTAITFAGFILVAQPTFLFGEMPHDHDLPSSTRFIGIIQALTASFIVAIVIIIVRKLGPEVHFSLSVIYPSLGAVILAVIYMTVKGDSILPCFNNIPILLACSACYFLAQMLRIIALQKEKAATVTLIQTTELIFSYLLQFIFLHKLPTLLGGIGACLIFLSSVVLAIKNILKTLRNVKQL